MKKKIIITGVSGFIGRHLAKLLSKEYSIIGIDRNWWDGCEKSSFHQIDINDGLPDYEDIYAVIHLAAKAGVRESQENFEQYVKDNILATKKLLDKCVESWKPKKILLASSSSIHGNYENGKHPKSLYAMTKVGMEEVMRTYLTNETIDENITIVSLLRIYTVYGPNQRKGLAMEKFINNILQDKPITIYGDGSQKRDFVYIDDLCEKISDILSVSYSNKYSLGNGKNYSINQIVKTISDITGKDVTIHYEPMNRYDVMETCSERPFIPEDYIETPIEEGLRKQIEWTKKQLDI